MRNIIGPTGPIVGPPGPITVVLSLVGLKLGSPGPPVSGCGKRAKRPRSSPHRSPQPPPLPAGGDGSDGEEAGMSVFGGDSWARDAQQRKRRLDDLMLPAPASSSPSTPESFRRLPNGKLACLVCPHRPVLDSPLMLSVSQQPQFLLY